MRFKGIYLSLATLLLVCACSSSGTNSKYCPEKGLIDARIVYQKNGDCKISYHYRNGEKHVQKPLVDIIAYDINDKILGRDKIYFQDVSPGKSKNVESELQCDNQKIVKIYINDAVDQNRCYGYRCSELCEIKGTYLRFK